MSKTVTTPTMSPVMPYVQLKQYQRISPTFDPFLKKYVKASTVVNFNNNYNRHIIKNNKKVIYRKKPTKRLNHYQHEEKDKETIDSSPLLNYNYVKTTDLQVSNLNLHDNKLVKVVPSDFVNCNLSDLIILICRMLENLISINNKLVPMSIANGQEYQQDNTKKSLLTRYHSRSPPNISALNYLTRLIKFNNFTNANLLTTIYYIDLLSYNYQPFFTLNSWTVHRFLLVATMVAQKSMEDFFFTNDHYAKVGGVDLTELNYLELDFLLRVNWKCIPTKTLDNGKSSIKHSKQVLDLYYRQLIKLMGNRGGKDEFIYMMGDDTEGEKVVENQHEVDRSKYDNQGYSIDMSSSPHLKRRFNV